MPAEVAEHLLAVLREALSNAARHAGATRVEVVLEVGDTLHLTVRDDGRGMPVEVLRRSGLANLAARAAAVGGRLEVRSGPDGGAELLWTADLRPAPDPA